jgi:hypothetical protein
VTPFFRRVYTKLSNKKRRGVSILENRNEKANGQRKSRVAARTRITHPSSSCQGSTLQLQRLLRDSRKVHSLVSILWHVLAGSNAVDCHLGVEFETAEELGRDEEVLASTAAVFTGSGAGDVD